MLRQWGPYFYGSPHLAGRDIGGKGDREDREGRSGSSTLNLHQAFSSRSEGKEVEGIGNVLVRRFLEIGKWQGGFFGCTRHLERNDIGEISY